MGINTKTNLDNNRFQQRSDTELDLNGKLKILGELVFDENSNVKICDKISSNFILVSDGEGNAYWQKAEVKDAFKIYDSILQYDIESQKLTPYKSRFENPELIFYIGDETPNGKEILNLNGILNTSNVKTYSTNTFISSSNIYYGENNTFVGHGVGTGGNGINLIGVGKDSLVENAGSNVIGIGSEAAKGNREDDMFFLEQRNVSNIPLIKGNFKTNEVNIKHIHCESINTNSINTNSVTGKTGNFNDIENKNLKTNNIKLEKNSWIYWGDENIDGSWRLGGGNNTRKYMQVRDRGNWITVNQFKYP